MNWMADQFLEDTGIDLRQDRLALQRLKEVAERAKCELSSTTETNINLPFIAADATGPKHFNKTLTRDQFEELEKDLVEQTIEPCHKALKDAKLQRERRRQSDFGRWPNTFTHCRANSRKNIWQESIRRN